MKRADALALARVAGYHGDSKDFTRLIVEARVNRAAMNQAWNSGSKAKAAGVKCDCHACKLQPAPWPFPTGARPAASRAKATFLKPYTRAELEQRAAAEHRAAEAKAQAERAPSPAGFVLTGSDTPVDVGAAHGQGSLL